MIVIFTIILVLVFWILAVEAGTEWDLEWLSALLFFFGGACIAGAFFINYSVCNIPTNRGTPLYAGYNNNEIHGEFFLGSGSVDETDMVYYWVNENGVKSKHSEQMNESVFIEDGKNIMVQRYNTCPSNLKWLLIDNSFGSFEFHVPENSIVQMYQYH